MQTFMSLTFVDLCLKKQCAFSRSLKSLQVSNPWTGLYQILTPCLLQKLFNCTTDALRSISPEILCLVSSHLRIGIAVALGTGAHWGCHGR